jgi:hypothetical protein
MTAIRHIAPPPDGGDVFATATFERTVSVWSFRQRKRIGTFDTILDFGGRRLTVACQQQAIVIAASFHGGVCAYDAHSGVPLWRRPEIPEVQYLSSIIPHNGHGLLGVGTACGTFDLVDLSSGITVRKLDQVRQVYCSRFSGAIVQVSADRICLSESRDWHVTLQRTNSKPVLAVAMNKTAYTVSASGGSLMSFDFHGRALWEWQPEQGHHVLSLCWQERLGHWVGVYWCFRSGGPKTLISFDQTGELVSKKPVDSVEQPIGECEFFLNGEFLVTSRGQVLTIPDLQLAWEFESVEVSRVRDNGIDNARN